MRTCCSATLLLKLPASVPAKERQSDLSKWLLKTLKNFPLFNTWLLKILYVNTSEYKENTNNFRTRELFNGFPR